jgi:uncharacterized protein
MTVSWWGRVLLLLAIWPADGTALAAGPAFDCSKVAIGSIEALICVDEELSALDRTLAEIYAAATAGASSEQSPILAAEQQGWINGRDDCWENPEPRRCIEDNYRLRIAELQARYRLVEAIGPVTYLCNSNPHNTVTATFYRTDPPTLIAEHGDQASLMYLQPSASGARYQGRNASFWEHHGEALVTWGHGRPQLRCAKQPADAPRP